MSCTHNNPESLSVYLLSVYSSSLNQCRTDRIELPNIVSPRPVSPCSLSTPPISNSPARGDLSPSRYQSFLPFLPSSSPSFSGDTMQALDGYHTSHPTPRIKVQFCFILFTCFVGVFSPSLPRSILFRCPCHTPLLRRTVRDTLLKSY